jgi:hypothetical protein
LSHASSPKYLHVKARHGAITSDQAPGVFKSPHVIPVACRAGTHSSQFSLEQCILNLTCRGNLVQVQILFSSTEILHFYQVPRGCPAASQEAGF